MWDREPSPTQTYEITSMLLVEGDRHKYPPGTDEVQPTLCTLPMQECRGIHRSCGIHETAQGLSERRLRKPTSETITQCGNFKRSGPSEP
jgi:hypothetical protein